MNEGRFPWKTLLFVSAGLNVLVIGAAVGVGVSGARLHRAVETVDEQPGSKAFMGALPPEKAPEIRKKLNKAWTDNGAELTAARDARQELFRLVSADQFDEAAVRAALAKVRAADARLTAKNQDAVIEVLNDLEPRQRAAALRAILRANFGPRRAAPAAGLGPNVEDRIPREERLRRWQERRQERRERMQEAPPQ